MANTKGLIKKIGLGLGAIVLGLGLNSCVERYATPKHKFEYCINTESIIERKGEDVIMYNTLHNHFRNVIINGKKYKDNEENAKIIGISKIKYFEMINERDSIKNSIRNTKAEKDMDTIKEQENEDLEILKR
jgi:hypothetical protein